MQNCMLIGYVAVECRVKSGNKRKLFFCFDVGLFCHRKNGLHSMARGERFGQTKSVVAHAIEAARDLGNDLQKRHVCERLAGWQFALTLPSPSGRGGRVSAR